MNKRKLISYILLLLAIAALYGLLLNLKVTESYPQLPTAAPPVPTSLLELTNAERAKAGVPPLLLDERLNRSAQAKADEIARTGVYEHTGSTGKRGVSYIEDVGVVCTGGGENLAGNSTSKAVITDWMNSPLHRQGMLNAESDTVGFGVSKGQGYIYVVGHYCTL